MEEEESEEEFTIDGYDKDVYGKANQEDEDNEIL